jgi:hypothetical protein
MADFLDQKEDVLKIEFTSYGRKKLATGNFMPSYYFFFDDTVIYDTNYAGVVEDTNDSKDRILNGLSIGSLNLVDDTLIMPLGNSSIFTDYAPAWDLKILNGGLTRIAQSSSYFNQIFNVNDIAYTAKIEKTNLSEYGVEGMSGYDLLDGRVIKVEPDYLLIELDEINCEDDYKNFDIEVYAYDKITGNNLERQLKFTQKQTNIINGIIYDESELPISLNKVKLTTDDVEYYFELLVDDEINFQLIDGKRSTMQDLVKNTYKSTFEGAVKGDC